MPQLGPAEILVVLVVALLVFGPKRLPEVGRQVGRGLRELRKLQDTVRDEINDVMHGDAANEGPPSYATSPAASPIPIERSGQHAPSRFRPASPPAVGAGTAPAPSASTPESPAPSAPPRAPTSSVPAPTRGRPAHAPSRFRAPGR